MSSDDGVVLPLPDVVAAGCAAGSALVPDAPDGTGSVGSAALLGSPLAGSVVVEGAVGSPDPHAASERDSATKHQRGGISPDVARALDARDRLA